ncbi:MAG: glucose-1-phosphate thymidylyltransferase [Bacillota bacterium]
MKALVLAGGKGTRLHPLTEILPKQLIPIANKPILHHVLEQVQITGVSDVGILTSPENYIKIKESIDKMATEKLNLSFIIQDKPAGLAHAVNTAGDFLGDSDFLMFLGDNMVDLPATFFMEDFKRSSADALILLKEVENPGEFGVAVLDEKGFVTLVLEKPKVSPSNLAVMGIYLFRKVIQEAISRIKPSWRGELEITDAIQELINMGLTVKAHIFEGWWIDTGKKNDVLEANRYFLDRLERSDLKGIVDGYSSITGRVEVGGGSLIMFSEINGPVVIGYNCIISNSVIGPYSSIGRGSIIKNAVVKNSILLEESRLERATIENTLISSSKISTP